MSAPVPFRHRLAAALVRALLALARAVPSWVLAPLGSLIGLVAWAVSPRLRRLGDANLRRVFPAWNARERSATLRGCARWLGESAAEALAVAFKRRSIHDVIRVAPETAALLAPSPRGTVVATGHVGNWELLGAALASLGHTTYAVVRRPRSTSMAAIVTDLRARLGWSEIPRGPHVALYTLRALRGGGLVGLLCDQASDQSNVRVPFLGIDAETPRGPALLARRSGARLVVAWLRRVAPWQFVLEAVAVAPSTDDGVTTAAINTVLGEVIRGHPTEWVWFHERWPPSLGERGSDA